MPAGQAFHIQQGLDRGPIVVALGFALDVAYIGSVLLIGDLLRCRPIPSLQRMPELQLYLGPDVAQPRDEARTTVVPTPHEVAQAGAGKDCHSPLQGDTDVS